MTLLQIVSIVLIFSATILAVEFTIAYHRKTRGRWRHSEDGMGRYLMAFSASIALVLSLSSINIIRTLIFGHGSLLWFDLLRIAAFGAVVFVLGWRRVMLSRVHRVSERPQKTE